MHSSRPGPNSVKQMLGYRVPRDVTSRAVLDYLSALDCPRALTVALLFEHQEFEQLVSLECNPNQYANAELAREAYLATSFLSKFGDFKLPFDKDSEAFRKFEKFELSCKRVNTTIRSDRARNWKNSELGHLLSEMAFKIGRIVGDVDGQEIFDSCDWGPGASTRIPSRDASAPHKFQYETGITRKLYDLLCPDGSLSILRGYSPRWCTRLIEEGFPLFQPGNKVVTVPKDSKSNRVIAIEPGFNIWFQKGVGSVLKRRLKGWGVDLTNQSRNQELARRSSLDDSLATIDFSSASDSIAYELVKELFPPLWFELLDRLRSQCGRYQGRTYAWEKFSSMGNGCTFEIETLIFFALALVCADREKVDSRDISVYGDDVIIPVSLVASFHRYSEALGFSFNTTKSFTAGPFRESCGAHWYRGVDFKPVYLKGRLNNIQSVYRLANSIRRLAHRWQCYAGCESRFRTPFYRLVHSIPGPLRFKIPDGFGDGGFIYNLDEAAPKRARHSNPSERNSHSLWIEGYEVKHVVDASIPAQVEHDGLLLARLKELDSRPDTGLFTQRQRSCTAWRWGLTGIISSQITFEPIKLSTRSDGNYHTNRDRTKPAIVTGLVPSWYNLGPWL